MENKNIILIAVAIIILAVVGFVLATGMLSDNNTTTTSFKTEFMEGAFVGNVTLANGTQKYMHSYEDKEHDVVYNISTVDNATALMEIYELQGLSNPDVRNFNGNTWNIYFSQAVPTTNNSTSKNNETMNIIVAESQNEKQGYLIYMIMGNDSDIKTTLNTFGEGYTDYMEPLLKSITLKENKNVPKIYEEFGLTKEQFDQQMELIHQYKSGNTSALQESSK